MMITFEKEVEQLQGRTTPMGTEEYLLDRFKKEGLEEGIQKGIQTGIQKGEAIGRHEEALEIARELKKEGLTVEFIAKTTKLSLEEIKAL